VLRKHTGTTPDQVKPGGVAGHLGQLSRAVSACGAAYKGFQAAGFMAAGDSNDSAGKPCMAGTGFGSEVSIASSQLQHLRQHQPSTSFPIYVEAGHRGGTLSPIGNGLATTHSRLGQYCNTSDQGSASASGSCNSSRPASPELSHQPPAGRLPAAWQVDSRPESVAGSDPSFSSSPSLVAAAGMSFTTMLAASGASFYSPALGYHGSTAGPAASETAYSHAASSPDSGLRFKHDGQGSHSGSDNTLLPGSPNLRLRLSPLRNSPAAQSTGVRAQEQLSPGRLLQHQHQQHWQACNAAPTAPTVSAVEQYGTAAVVCEQSAMVDHTGLLLQGIA
jgi:hypothetical protein